MVIPKEAPDYDHLASDCPNRAQNSRPHEIDGCSVPSILAVLTPGLSVQDPTGGIFGLASTRFGQSQPTGAPALPLPCNQHDICYQTCGSTQAACDTGMLNAMEAVCSAAYPSASCPYSGLEAVAKCFIGILGRTYFVELLDCYKFAALYKFGLDKFGSNAWEERQVQYCDCCQ